MEYIWEYKTPEGFDDLVMSGDGEALTGLWFAGSRDAARRGEAVELRESRYSAKPAAGWTSISPGAIPASRPTIA